MKWQIKRFDLVKSTNETAKSFPADTVVISNRQSSGYGRYGRSWESPEGNLYLSAVLNDEGEKTPLLSLVAGVAVAEALSDFQVHLKWPNDVLLDGGKVAGILLERTEKNLIVMGIGINVASCPKENMMYKTACLGSQISLAEVEKNVLISLEENLNIFKKESDIIIKKWIKYSVGIGEQIQVRLPHLTLTGLFQQLSPKGELILETPDKIVHKINAGDVFLI